MTYTNPVWPDYFADPFVLRWQGYYYAYGTGGPEASGGTPGGRVFPVLRSRNLADWEPMACALEVEGGHPPAFWAPEVAERNGRFYLFFSTGGAEGAGQRLRVATADTPLGPFRDSGRLLLPDEPFSIDASPFRDPADGRWYLFFAKDFLDGRVGTGVAVAPLADDMGSITAAPRTAIRATADWQIYQRGRRWSGRVWDAWHTVEGPSVVVHEGRYYCFYSGGRWSSSGYGVGFGVADNAMGPYVDPHAQDGPSVLRSRVGFAVGPGHNSVILAPDGETVFAVYHAWDRARTARRMFIDPILWSAEGPRVVGPSRGGTVPGA